MALNVIDKINLRFKFLYRQNRFLTPPLCKLLCNALIKPLSDYGCTNLVSKSSKKTKIKTSSNAKKCISFCLQLNKMSGICVKEFLELNWFNVHDRCLQLIASDTFKFYNNQCPGYFNEALCPVDDNGVATRYCNKKLKLPFRKPKLAKGLVLGTNSLTTLRPLPA